MRRLSLTATTQSLNSFFLVRSFSGTQKLLPCRVEDDCERSERLHNEKQATLDINKKLEKDLCEARSLIAKIWMVMSDELPYSIKTEVIEQLNEQHQHRMSEWKLAVKKTWAQLSEIEDSDLIGESKGTREERLQIVDKLQELYSINTTSPEFLDRDCFKF